MVGKRIRMERIMDRNSGKAVSLVNLQEGSEVLVYRESSGRHFGVRIDETILEK